MSFSYIFFDIYGKIIVNYIMIYMLKIILFNKKKVRYVCKNNCNK